MNRTVVLLGGPADLTRMAVPESQGNWIEVSGFAARPTLNFRSATSESAPLRTTTYRYERTSHYGRTNTEIYEWTGQ
jgi:hypothetical protein